MKQIPSQGEMKNRYYKGKQLNSADFIMEQNYLEQCNKKTNLYAIGTGILHGCALQPYHDMQFLLSSGCVIDEHGTLLVIEQDQPIACKEVKGFDAIDHDIAHVFIQAKETPVDRVFCAMSETADQLEENHIQCSWELVMRSQYDNRTDDFFLHQILYEDQKVIITQKLPMVLPAQEDGSLMVEVTKKKGHVPCHFQYHLHAVDLLPETMEVSATLCDETKRVECFVFPLHRNSTYGNTSILLEGNGTITVEIAGKKRETALSIAQHIPLVPDVSAWLTAYCDRLGPNKHETGVYLGTIELEEKRRTWKIANITSETVMNHLTPYDIRNTIHQVLQSYHIHPVSSQPTQHPETEKEQRHAGIVCVDQMRKEGNLYTSQEISHGFGANEVQITLCFQTQQWSDTGKQSVLIQGNSTLFHPHRTTDIQLASKVMIQDGTFQIACQASELHPETSFIVWEARMIEREVEQPQAMALIRLEPSIVELAPLQTCTFTPVFDSPQHVCECSFSLLQEDGGIIGDDGIYHASTKPGIYQIRAESTQGDIVYAYAFVKAGAS